MTEEKISKETKKKLFQVDDDNLHTIDTLVPSKKGQDTTRPFLIDDDT